MRGGRKMDTDIDLAVLLIEDSPDDAELIAYELKREWPRLVWQRVESELEFKAALNARCWQIVLSDFALPGFGPKRALEVIAERQIQIPLIIVSGVLSTADAVAVMRSGATDFVAKSDLPRLHGAIGRELEHQQERHEAVGVRLQLAASDKLLRVLRQAVDQSPISVVLTRMDGTIEYVNTTLCQTKGYSPEELIGSNPRIWQSAQTPQSVYRDIWDTVLAGDEWRGELLNCNKDGELVWDQARIAPIRDDRGEIVYVVGIYEDVTEGKRNREALDRLASIDTLTGLPNRAVVLERIAEIIARVRVADQSFAVLFVDLDLFRAINDSMGHRAGDTLLLQATERIRVCLRQGDIVGRIGGDEFVVVLAEAHTEQIAAQVASRLLGEMGRPIALEGREMVVTCSIGVAMYPASGADAETLLRNSDAAMYQAKLDGRDAYRFFSGEINARIDRRMQIESQLRQAIHRGELALHYQPQLSLRSGQITGAEALLRWHSPTLGLVAPAEFIPVAEESGLILAIGRWVLQQACAQSRAWTAAGLPPLRVAVNVSTRQFADVDLCDQVARVLAESGLQAGLLEIEITESALIRDAAGAIRVVAELRKLGVRVSLDDFGTGYSSLAYLSRLPINTLKIDQSFVRDITTNPANAMIATATIALAHNMGLNVVGEGVETEGQANYLRSRGCDEVQGYFFSRPLPPEKFAALLHERSTRDQPVPKEELPTLLLVDDEPNVLNALRRLLRRDGIRVLSAGSAAEGLELLARNRVQVVVSDHRMPLMSGTEFLSKVKDLYPETVRMVLSGYADIDSVTKAINQGAIYRFLSKPWDDDDLRDQIRSAFRQQAKGQSVA